MTSAIELGLPTNDLRDYRLVFNVATSTLAVQVWVARGDLCAGEIYIRPQGASTYQRAVHEPDTSDESLITCDGPYLFFIRMVPGPGFKFRGIVRLDLRTSQFQVFMTRDMKAGHQWVAALQSATPDGRTVYARVGSLPNQARSGAYGIWRIDLLDETATELVVLPALYV